MEKEKFKQSRENSKEQRRRGQLKRLRLYEEKRKELKQK